MRNHAAYGFALLLLVQAMTAAITVVPSEQKQEELETPFVERSSGSNNSSSPCGSNVNYTNVYAYAPYMVIENQSFTTSSYVYCEILSANMMLDYSIVNANNSTVYSGNLSWTGSNASSSNYTWNVSGLSAGYYTFHADLYVNGTFVDTSYDSFMVYANTSGGGGGGGSGNYTSPCGNNANYSYVYAYAPYMLMENQSFTTSSYVYCEILNANMMLDYSIVNANNSTVYSGNHSWTGSNSSGLKLHMERLWPFLRILHLPCGPLHQRNLRRHRLRLVHGLCEHQRRWRWRRQLHLTMWERCKLLLCVRLRSLHAH